MLPTIDLIPPPARPPAPAAAVRDASRPEQDGAVAAMLPEDERPPAPKAEAKPADKSENIPPGKEPPKAETTDETKTDDRVAPETATSAVPLPADKPVAVAVLMDGAAMLAATAEGLEGETPVGKSAGTPSTLLPSGLPLDADSAGRSPAGPGSAEGVKPAKAMLSVETLQTPVKADAAATPRPDAPAPPQNFDAALNALAPLTQGGAPATQAITAAPAAALTSHSAPTAAIPIQGVALEIAAQAQIGRSRFEIRLDPPELGRIDVRLDIDDKGHVTSRLIVERAETLDLLRRDAPQLERALQQAGLKTSDSALEFSLRDQSLAREQRDAPQPHRAHLVVTEDAPVERAPYRPLHAGGAGLDIRV